MERKEVLARIRREARPYLPQIVVAMLLGTLAGALNVVQPAAFGQIVNRVLVPHPDLRVLYIAILAIWVSLITVNVATYFQTYLTAWCGQHLIKRLRIDLFERVLNLPIGGFDRWRPGELIARFSADLQLMTDAVSISLPQMVSPCESLPT